MNICPKCGYNQELLQGQHSYICPEFTGTPVSEPVDPMFFGFLMGISDRALMSVDTFLVTLDKDRAESGSTGPLSVSDIGRLIGVAVSAGVSATVQVLGEQGLIDGGRWDDYFSEMPSPDDF